jgi:hypothetical protein
MKNKFVADGYRRFLQGKKALIAESIERKHAAELASAGPDKKAKIQERLAAELVRREKALNHQPSAATLW